MGKRLCFAALALLVPAAVQAQGLESLLSSIEEANEDKLNPVAEHPPLTAPPDHTVSPPNHIAYRFIHATNQTVRIAFQGERSDLGD